MTRKTGVAIIGLGPASQPHSRSLADLADRVDVRWAVSRSAERTNAYSEQFSFPTTNDMDAALRDPLVDAVIVLTPPSSHLDVAERCLAAGKHVLVEKPLELTVPRAEKLVQLASASGCRFGVVLQHRFRPASVRLKRALDGGELGRVQAGFLAVPWWRPQSYYDEPGRGTLVRDGGGVLLTQAIHSLDLFRSLVGVSEVIRSDVRTTDLHRMETEDLVAAILRLGNGATGTLMATTAAYPGYPGADRNHRHQGICGIDRRDPADIVPRRPGRARGSRKARPAAVPASWTFLTIPTALSSPISWTRSATTASPWFPARRRLPVSGSSRTSSQLAHPDRVLARCYPRQNSGIVS